MDQLSDLQSLSRKIDELSARLAAAEASIAELRWRAGQPVPSSPPVAPPALAKPAVRIVPDERGYPIEVPDVPATPVELIDTPIPAPRVGPPPLPRATTLFARPLPPTAPKKSRSLESTIGLNWTGWIGAIVFVLGVLFFLKYAWDQGWINPTPTMRVVFTILVGIGISGLGEWMHRRKARVLASTLHGAGLAIVISAFFASYAMFDADQRVLGPNRCPHRRRHRRRRGACSSRCTSTRSSSRFSRSSARISRPSSSTPAKITPQLCSRIWARSPPLRGVLAYLKDRWLAVRALAWAATFLSLAGWWWFGMGERNHHTSLAVVWLCIYYAGFLVEMIPHAPRARARRPRRGAEQSRDALAAQHRGRDGHDVLHLPSPRREIPPGRHRDHPCGRAGPRDARDACPRVRRLLARSRALSSSPSRSRSSSITPPSRSRGWAWRSRSRGSRGSSTSPPPARGRASSSSWPFYI